MKIKNLTVKQLMKKNVANSKVMQNLAYGAAKRKVDTLKKELLKELNDHPVTKEIEQGPMGMNSSLLGGYGNFFGFLGFTPSQKPVQIIREGFEKFIQVEKKPRLNKLSQKSFEWELRQAEIKWKNEQSQTINEFGPGLMNQEQLLANREGDQTSGFG